LPAGLVGLSMSRAYRGQIAGTLLMTLVIALGVGVAWLAARDAPSSAVGDIAQVPRASITSSQGCQNFVDYWIDDIGLDLDPLVFEGFTNCRQDTDGRWRIWSEVSGERRQTLDDLDEQTLEGAIALRSAIVEDLEALVDRISPELRSSLDNVHSGAPNPVIGHTREGVSVSSVRTRYARLMNGFMLDPDRAEVASYVGWVMKQRMDSYGAFRRTCLGADTEWLRQPCVGMEDNLSVRYVPWYWDLYHPMYLDAYILSVVQDGE
jgi:hypothetical protein